MSVLAELLEPAHLWEVGGAEDPARVMLLDQPAPDYMGAKGLTLLLSELWVPRHQREQGYGTQLVKVATRWADKAGIELWLYVASYDRGPSEFALRDFYRDFGFETRQTTPNVEMFRPLKAKGARQRSR